MLLKTTVPIPRVEGKIVKQRKKDVTYVYYETGREYDPKRKFNVPKRALIGKLAEGSSDRMVPNTNYLKYFPETTIAPNEPARCRSNTLRLGAFVVIKKIIESAKLDKLLDDAFGSDAAGLLQDLLADRIVNADNHGPSYREYARSHPLFAPEMRIVSDSTLSAFLAELSQEQVTAFLADWNRKRDRTSIVYVVRPTACRQADDQGSNTCGCDSEQDIIDLSIALDGLHQEPLLYATYPSFASDLGHMAYMADKAREFDYRNLGFVFNHGELSDENVAELEANKHAFLWMLKVSSLSQLDLDQNFGGPAVAESPFSLGCHLPLVC